MNNSYEPQQRATAKMSSLSKACLELSNSIKGLRLSRTLSEGGGPGRDSLPGGVRTSAVTSTLSRALKSATSRVKAFDRNGHLPAPILKKTVRPLEDEKLLNRLFLYFSPSERCVLAQVCRQWRDVLYSPHFWFGVTPIIQCKDWSKTCGPALGRFYDSLVLRGFDSVALVGATDSDVSEFVASFPVGRNHFRMVCLRCSNVTDIGLECLLENMTSITKLELSGCNEITEAGLWSCLSSRLVVLHISDCINVADDSVGAIAQLLPSLNELTLQAYHVTDTALSYFSAKQSCALHVLRLQSCWEITNHGIVNVVHSLPNLSVLSLSGCSKITDDGVELIAENLRNLKVLDLSWCPRITDAALEYIACDLGQLEELSLDRCSHITDIGVGYLSTMTSLCRLFLRWCTQLRDFGLQHLYTMKSLTVLSLAGCSSLTATGLTGLIQMHGLQELELTNCPGATAEVYRYLKDNMASCLLID